jgi:hypothetical protein
MIRNVGAQQVAGTPKEFITLDLEICSPQLQEVVNGKNKDSIGRIVDDKQEEVIVD